jgi:thioredoxin reductase (NADPH)
VNEIYDAVIIGGGPAGSAAAAFLAGRQRKTIILDKGILEGYLGGSSRIVGFPGFPDFISGTEIVNRMRRQAENMGASIKTAVITGVDFEGKNRKVISENETLESRTVFLATGACGRTGYSAGEKEFRGRGVSHSAELEGPAIKGQTIAAIGKTKYAAEEVLFLSKYARKIHFIIPSNRLDIDSRLLSKLQNSNNIELLFSTSPKSINGQERVNSVTVFTGGQEKEIPVASVFAYLYEYQPNTAYLKDAVQVSSSGEVMVDENLQTSVPGVFACGDIICGRPQFPAVSAAQGLLAGINANKYLEKEEACSGH